MSFRFEKASNSNRNPPPFDQNEVGSMITLPNDKNSTQVKLSLFSEFGDNWVEITIPAITVSEANGGVKKSFKRNGKTFYKGEHYMEKSHRHVKQKGQVHLLLKPLRSKLGKPCKIFLTRFAPDKLDRFDNLPMSLKWILDATCEVITNDYRPGRADDNPLILDVKYDQIQNKEYGVKIRIENII